MQNSAHCGNLALASFSPVPLLIFGGCLAELFSLVFPTSFFKQPHKLALVSPPKYPKSSFSNQSSCLGPALRGGEIMPNRICGKEKLKR